VTLAQRRILIGASVIAFLTILVPPWQNSWHNDNFIGWRLLLRPPTTNIPMIDYEMMEGRLPSNALENPETVERLGQVFVASPANVAWNVLITEWLVLVACAVGFWFGRPGAR
jgi:hypothetical protein